jgi:nitrate/nitrite transport system substrate-binding protein
MNPNDDRADRHDPYDADRPLRLNCSCGQHASAADHAAGVLRARSETAQFEADSNNFIEASLMKALFPQDEVRRNFLRAVGRRTAMAAIGSVLPIASLQAMAQDKGAIEKRDLKIGFIPITCATPLIMAKPLGFYEKQGLNVEVVKTAR